MEQNVKVTHSTKDWECSRANEDPTEGFSVFVFKLKIQEKLDMQLSTVTSGRLHPQADIVIPYSLLSHQDRTMWDTIALKQYSMFFMPEVEDFQLCEWSSYDLLFFFFLYRI